MIIQNVNIEKLIVGNDPSEEGLSSEIRQKVQPSQISSLAAGTVSIDSVACINGGQAVEVTGSAKLDEVKADVLIAAVITDASPPSHPPTDGTIFIPTGINFVIPSVPVGSSGGAYVSVWAFFNQEVDSVGFNCSSSSSSSSPSSSSSAQSSSSTS